MLFDKHMFVADLYPGKGTHFTLQKKKDYKCTYSTGEK